MNKKLNDNKINRHEMTPFRRYLPIMLTIVIGILVSFILFTVMNNWEREKQQIEFESLAMQYAQTIQNKLQDYIESLHSVGDFFNNSEQVTRKEFSDYVISAIARKPGIQAFGWNPLILNSERAYYESLAKEDGLENFMITERTENKELVRAAVRDEYVVVYYLEPLEGNDAALGYDLGSNPTRRKAINRAFDTGNLSATERISLVQDTGEQFGVLILHPIYKQNVPVKTVEDRRKHRKGFVVEVLRIGDSVEIALKDILDEGIDIYLYDASADVENQFLYFRPSLSSEMTKQPLEKEEIQKGIYWSINIDLADRQWQLLFSPSTFYFDSRQSMQAWILLSGSLLLTCLLAFYLSRKSIYTDEIEQQLLKNEQILKTTMDGFIVADMTGNIIEVNDSYCRMSGYTQEELVNMNIREIELTGTSEEIDRRIKHIVEQGSDSFETRHTRKDGDIIDLDVSAVIMKQEKTPLVAAFVRNITDIKMTEKTLREERNKAQKYLDIAGVMLATLDEEGKVTLVNQRGSEILGYREEDIIGKNWFECFLPERLRKEVYQVFLQLMAGDITPLKYYENPVLIQGGEERLIAFHNTVIKNPSGDITGVLFSGEDITDRKKAEIALISEQKFTETVLDTQIDTFFLFEPDTGKAVRWNRQFQKISGFSDEEISAMKAPDSYYSQEDLEKAQGTISDVMSRGQGKVDISLICKDGRTIPFEYLFSVIRDNDNKIKYLLSVGRDITENRKAEMKQRQLTAELIIKNKDLEQVLYVTSHDLRSPLVNVEGYSRELEYSLNNLISSIDHADVPSSIKDKITPIVNEEIPESFHYIRTSVSKMDMLLRGILSLSRLGRYELTISELDMNAMMSDIVDSHRFRLNKLRIKTEVSKLPNCKGDSSQIDQVFSNLIDNAIKYSDPERSSVIKISGYKDQNKSVYCIEDNGIGIAPAHQDKIFEIFHQLEPNRVKGEGMGLTIAHKLMEKHNGRIWVESELGRGSRFYVSLPS